MRKLHEKHKEDKGEGGAMRYLDGRWLWVAQQAPPEGEDEFA